MIPSAPSLRPADILSRAAHHTLDSAIDIMIKAPHSCGAGSDCVEAGKSEKLDKYAGHLGELEQQGIRFAPAVFSCFGRRHPDVDDMLAVAARRFVRQAVHASSEPMLARWRRRLTAAVWKRAARMVHRCIWAPPGCWDDITRQHHDADDATPAWVASAAA